MNTFGSLISKKNEQKSQKPTVPYVELEVSTWAKDSHALYDYEGVDNKFQVDKYDLKDSVNIFRHVTTTRTIFQTIHDESKGQKRKELPMENIYISSLVFKKQKNSYFVQSADVSGIEPHPILKEEHPDLFKNSFLVLRGFKSAPNVEGYALKSGNILRLGRVQYLVTEVKNQNGLHSFKQPSNLEQNGAIYQVGKNLEGCCKVCLCEESTPEDPLINPCNCKGSCECIHVGCLKSWMFSKIKKEIVGVATTYNYSKLQCEICKVPLPKTIKLLNLSEVQMISLDRPDKPYVILESFNDKQVKEDKKERNIHLLCPSEQYVIKLGRGHQCEIRLTDISVSRTHSQIRYENGEFYVKDLESKFGTLIKFREQLQLKQKLKFQHGRTCYEFRLIKEDIKVQKGEKLLEDLPVFYTRAQLREMGQLEEDEDEQF